MDSVKAGATSMREDQSLFRAISAMPVGQAFVKVAQGLLDKADWGQSHVNKTQALVTQAKSVTAEAKDGFASISHAELRNCKRFAHPAEAKSAMAKQRPRGQSHRSSEALGLRKCCSP